MKEFLRKHWQLLFNIWLFATLAIGLGWDLYDRWAKGRLDYIEISFAAQNALWITMVLVRRQHLAVDRNVFNQLVALLAFFSGLALPAAAESGPPLAIDISRGMLLASNLFGIVTILNLGRSFGILIAMRQVRTGGLYRVIRHPMYATDILLRVGYIISHFSLPNLGIVLGSTACYVYRAVQEEKFLSQWPEYQEYREKVRYRFIPGVF
jgi:protein-S-isoprenylcysteine O-methyltransferase Ste14